MPILSPRATRRSIPDKAGRSRPSYWKSRAFTSMVSTSATGCVAASISSRRAHSCLLVVPIEPIQRRLGVSHHGRLGHQRLQRRHQSVGAIGESGDGRKGRIQIAIGPDEIEKRGDAGADGHGLHEKHRHHRKGFAARYGVGVLQRRAGEAARVAAFAPEQPQLLEAAENLVRLAKPSGIRTRSHATRRQRPAAESQIDAGDADAERERCDDGDQRVYQHQQRHEEDGNDGVEHDPHDRQQHASHDLLGAERTALARSAVFCLR